MPQVAVSVLELTLSFGIKRQWTLQVRRAVGGLRAIQPWQNSIATAIHDRLINIVVRTDASTNGGSDGAVAIYIQFLIQPKRGYAFRADGYYETRSPSTVWLRGTSSRMYVLTVLVPRHTRQSTHPALPPADRIAVVPRRLGGLPRLLPSLIPCAY
ncbi:hypothetical protein FIBSPDRAFT_439467 [Athelia psychrophila]|uniref:Uncharacterized protein n=1 Tax=Athelia psychrophila TaxID=1759441 RepID=A0A166VT64_9AGAM|nr:hypothetical protein FIBSPDRAFT_439467 [Fibularhizoctonia sp. CBS 109695]